MFQARDVLCHPLDTMTPMLPPNDDCARAHQILQTVMTLLDGGFRSPELRAVRGRLIDRGTVACAHARLGRHDDLRAALEAMMADAETLPDQEGDDHAASRLQALVRAALSGEPAEERSSDH